MKNGEHKSPGEWAGQGKVGAEREQVDFTGVDTDWLKAEDPEKDVPIALGEDEQDYAPQPKKEETAPLRIASGKEGHLLAGSGEVIAEQDTKTISHIETVSKEQRVAAEAGKKVEMLISAGSEPKDIRESLLSQIAVIEENIADLQGEDEAASRGIEEAMRDNLDAQLDYLFDKQVTQDIVVADEKLLHHGDLDSMYNDALAERKGFIDKVNELKAAEEDGVTIDLAEAESAIARKKLMHLDAIKVDIDAFTKELDGGASHDDLRESAEKELAAAEANLVSDSKDATARMTDERNRVAAILKLMKLHAKEAGEAADQKKQA